MTPFIGAAAGWEVAAGRCPGRTAGQVELDQARAEGQAGQVGAAAAAGLVPDPVQVRADRADADVQLGGVPRPGQPRRADALGGGQVPGLGQYLRQELAAHPACPAGGVGPDLLGLPGQPHGAARVAGGQSGDAEALQGLRLPGRVAKLSGQGLSGNSESGIGVSATASTAADVALQVNGRVEVQGSSAGSVTMAKGTKTLTVSNAAVTANSLIFPTPLGDPNAFLWIGARSAGSFTIDSSTTLPAAVTIGFFIMN